ncbi:5-hydroxytryptamine receptor 3A-like isoform X6 [Syngnathoides biaculeatus]|uniref:5-hydroxytryptamine receptor 3A-like isoform X6 n=1 Tax=Syngnathoides biaculeatus TaxID=300417 RepID=UPI002ADE598D|nr:5-hydroxytryptamine receptor 3A-like isoform X6 [Syngnathoides biaculeatus]
MFTAFVVSLLILPATAAAAFASESDGCSYQDVLNHLGLNRSNELFSMTRPVKNYKKPTHVSLEVLLYAILNVVEKEQKFVPYVWTVTRWHNDFISWDPQEFCGINNVSLPVGILWKPDLTIEEMAEKDKAPPNLYLTIRADGLVEVTNDQVLFSMCRMNIYNFPFDIQRCNLSFKSIIHSAKELRLQPSNNSSEATEWSRDLMPTQFEWIFLKMKVTAIAASCPDHQDVIIYTITMRRKPILYIINFLLPVFFFLALDLASFFISDSGGEKLSFKVTVMLAVTVLQLILNEILPSSSNSIPLIAVYCIGIFALMLLSLLETILVMHLLEKDHKSQDDDDDRDGGPGRSDELNIQNDCCNQHGDPNAWTQCGIIYSTPDTPTEVTPGSKDDSSAALCQTLQKLSGELRQTERALSLLLDGRKEKPKTGYWTQVAGRLNRIFFVFYLTVVVIFLTILFSKWTSV